MPKHLNQMDILVGQNIRRLRLTKGLSLDALASNINGGVTMQQLQKYEAGKNRVAAGTLFEISTILGAPIWEFFSVCGPGTVLNLASSRRENDLITNYNNIDDDDIKRAAEIMISALSNKFKPNYEAK